MLGRLACLFAVLAVSACADRAPAPRAAAVRFALADFQRLRWLEGDWRGRGSDGLTFFEAYRFTDDSTLAVRTYADSARERLAGEGVVKYRQGYVIHERDEAVWTAAALDRASVRFQPAEGSSSGFAWTSATADTWTATLRPPTGSSVVYRMERLPVDSTRSAAPTASPAGAAERVTPTRVPSGARGVQR